MSTPQNSFSIYVHVPFCVKKCDYCDFYSVAQVPDSRSIQWFVDSIKTEFRYRLPQFLSNSASRGGIHSVFFGGGTPSLLPPEAIQELVDHFEVPSGVEITVEANPEQLTSDYLKRLNATEVNRIHTGIQTFRPAFLDQVNRHYQDRLPYIKVLELLREYWKSENFGVDLIYGFAGQSRQDFYDDLVLALSIEPAHLSVYSLTREENTPYHQKIQQGLVRAPQQELQYDLFRRLPGFLESRGFTHYEISNYARVGQGAGETRDYRSRHNLGYWLYEPYMGLGPSAHGFDGVWRYSNPSNLSGWGQAVANADYPRPESHIPELDVPLTLLRLTGWISSETIDQVVRRALRARDTSVVNDLENRTWKWQAAIKEDFFADMVQRGLVIREPGPLFGSAAGSTLTPDSGLHPKKTVPFGSRDSNHDQYRYRWTVEGQLGLDDRIVELSDLLSLASGDAGT